LQRPAAANAAITEPAKVLLRLLVMIDPLLVSN